MTEAVRTAISQLVDGARPDGVAMAAAFEAILTGETDPVLIAAFLVALRVRGERVEDIVAGARVLRAHVLPVAAPSGAVDTCGTGGLNWTSLNTSTAAAFVAAGAGVVVAKHGNRSKSKAGSADVLETLGVNLTPSEPQIANSFARAGLSFLFAPVHHSAMKHVAPVRAVLGTRTIFNFLGPLANPAGAKRQVLGVFSEEWVRPYAEALLALGSDAAWVVHGLDGLDEISISGPSRIAELKAGAVRVFDITPEEIGVERVPLDRLRGGTVEQNAAALLAVLRGEGGPFADLVAANAGAALIVGGKADNLREGYTLARESIASGRALGALDALKAASNG